MSIPADAAGVKSPGNLLPACVEQRCLLKSFNPPFTAPLLRICAEIRKGICKKNPKKPFVSGREGDLNHRVLENFSHLFIPGPDISEKKKPQPLSKLREGSGKVNPGTVLPSAVLEAVSPWKMLSWVGLGCPWVLQGRRGISPELCLLRNSR